ncbi:MAG: hypothetical protein NTX50_05960 [Candidatus Sumerlaeota bacterium]|nr:hypothetical protein [Candidatus Sumerlaeota bacterium]
MGKLKTHCNSERSADNSSLPASKEVRCSEYMYYSLFPDYVTILSPDYLSQLENYSIQDCLLDLFPMIGETGINKPDEKRWIYPHRFIDEETYKTSTHPDHYVKVPAGLLEDIEGNSKIIISLIVEAKRRYNKITCGERAFICVADYGPYYCDTKNYCPGIQPSSGTYSIGDLVADCALKIP